MNINFTEFQQLLTEKKLKKSLPLTVCSHSTPIFEVFLDEPEEFKHLSDEEKPHTTTSPMRRASTAREVVEIGIHRLEKRRNNSKPEVLGYVKKP